MTRAGQRETSWQLLLDPVGLQRHDWCGHDLSAMTAHQLRVELRGELVAHAARLGISPIADAGIPAAAGCPTLADVLSHPDAPDEVFVLAKGLARLYLDDAQEMGLPGDVARVLYIAVLVAAGPRRLPRISALRCRDVLREARRCLTCGWLPARLRDGLRSGMRDPDWTS